MMASVFGSSPRSTIETMEKEKKLPHFELTGSIMQCCFEVMKELGPGFLERIYHKCPADCDETKGSLGWGGAIFRSGLRCCWRNYWGVSAILIAHSNFIVFSFLSLTLSLITKSVSKIVLITKSSVYLGISTLDSLGEIPLSSLLGE